MLDALSQLDMETISAVAPEGTTPSLLGDLENVGQNKPLGFLSRKTISNSGTQLETIQADLLLKGLETKVFSAPDHPQESDVLLAFDRPALQALLDKNVQLLKDSGWPTDSDNFISWVANRERDLTKVVPGKTALYDLIADGFADYENPDRLVPIFLQPREGKTGIADDPCLVYGNGVEIETIVRYKSPLEKTIARPDGSTRQQLSRQGGANAQGVDIVKIHFLPKTSLAERASDPALVPQEEREQIKVDCIQGFMSLAHGLAKNEVTITDHQLKEDFYLLADTNPGLALFLINSCGFRGNARSGQAWVRASEFSTEENVRKMLTLYKNLVEKNSKLV